MASNGAEESVGIDMENGQAVENEAIGGEGKNELSKMISVEYIWLSL